MRDVTADLVGGKGVSESSNFPATSEQLPSNFAACGCTRDTPPHTHHIPATYPPHTQHMPSTTHPCTCGCRQAYARLTAQYHPEATGTPSTNRDPLADRPAPAPPSRPSPNAPHCMTTYRTRHLCNVCVTALCCVTRHTTLFSHTLLTHTAGWPSVTCSSHTLFTHTHGRMAFCNVLFTHTLHTHTPQDGLL